MIVRVFGPMFLGALLSGCAAVGPDYSPPTLELPTTWQTAVSAELTAGPPSTDSWWAGFADPLLDGLIATALQQNLDLRAAVLRLDSARAQRGIAAADRLPTVDTTASYTYRDESRNTPFGAFIPRTDIHSATFDAVWELDLWGRVRRSIEAADAQLEASQFDLQAAALTVAAEVARTYVDLRAAQRRLAIARANLVLQEQTLALVEARLGAGLAVERDIAQARTNVETTRSRLPQFEAATAIARNRLAVLLGTTAQGLPVAIDHDAPLPRLPLGVAIGAPADLLRRRPDVHRAERLFAAQVARIGVAEAERYPTFSLSGQVGLAANSARDWIDEKSDLYGFGPSLRWNLFDGGRLRNRITSLEAEAEAAQVAWEQTVLLAIEETENALTRYVREKVRRESLARAAQEARRAVELARTQYREGLSDFQAVLDSERVVATIEDDLAASDATVATELIALFKALGGGLPERGA